MQEISKGNKGDRTGLLAREKQKKHDGPAKKLNLPFDLPDDEHESGICDALFHLYRQCLGRCVLSKPPEPAAEVVALLVEMKLTPRQVHQFYRVFRYLKQFDSWSSTAGPFEIGMGSMIRLVPLHRNWVAKLLFLLLDLAGFKFTVSWDGFLFVCMQFCRFSKMELCQVMFYMISKCMKNWSVHYLTSTQLDEFYEDWETCPIQSFSTANIKFSRLPLAKYTMTDFVELAYRFPPLLNPFMHLQRSIQQQLPSLRYWTDIDRMKVLNRKIPIDFLRFRKVQNLTDLLSANIKGKVHAQQKALSATIVVEMVDPEDAAAAAQSKDTLAGNIPVPLGPLPPPRDRLVNKKTYPSWLEALLQTNEDPVKGVPIGTANEKPIRWADLPPVILPGDPRSVDEAKRIIASSFADRARVAAAAAELTEAREIARKKVEEKIEKVVRSQELEFIQKAREELRPPDSLVDTMRKLFLGELIERPSGSH